MPYSKIPAAILIQVLFSLFFYSCEFETDKVYERKVDKDVEPPEITVVDLDLEEDTIYLLKESGFTFRFTSSNQEITAVRVTIDGTQVTVSNSGQGYYLLDYANLTEGEHSLILEVITKSGTNSIADILGAEGFVFSKSWVLTVFKSYYRKLNPEIKYGCLYFSWEKYPVHDFTEYIIYRENNNLWIEVGRTKSTEFTDCSYVGEGGRYFIQVLKTDGELLSWGGYVELKKDLPELSFTGTIDNEYIIKWNRSKYYNAVNTFYLSANSRPGIKVKQTSDPSDTSWNVSSEFIFGDKIDLTLLLIPKNSVIYTPDENYRFESVVYDVTVGFRFKPDYVVNLYHVTQAGADEFIYILGCDTLVKYSVSQKHNVEMLTYTPSHCSMCKFLNFKISPSGKFLTTRIDCEYDLMVANVRNLQDNKRYNLQSYSGQYSISDVPISDTGTGIVTGTASGFYVYDFNTSSSPGYYNKQLYGATGLAVSSNGKYIFLKDDVFRLVSFDNSQFTSIWNYPGSDTPKYYEFHGTDPERLVIWDGSLFSVRKCSDFSEYYNFTLSDNSLLNIDYYSNEMLTYSEGHLFVRSLADGALLKDIPVNIDPTNWLYRCILVNHAIICNMGVIYFMN